MENTLFFHGITTDGYRFTIAGKFQIDSAGTEVLSLGVSICSKTDQFVRRWGRLRAEKRLNSGTYPGSVRHSLYGDRFVEFKGGNFGYAENWYKGREVEIFVYTAKLFNIFEFKSLKQYFGIK